MIKKVSHLKFRLRVAFSQINSGCLHNSSLRLNRHFFLSPWGEELGKFYCIWHINFDCAFVFGLATLNSYILFLHWQRNWHPYGKLASCYACFDFYHDRNQGGRRGEKPPRKFFAPPWKMCWTQFKKFGPVSENSSPLLLSQAGYGPALYSCRMSILTWYFCVQDVEKLRFWMCIWQVSMLCHFCLFFKLCLGVFNNPVATPAYGLRGHRPSFRLRFISENACLFALYVYVTTHGPTSLS